MTWLQLSSLGCCHLPSWFVLTFLIYLRPTQWLAWWTPGSAIGVYWTLGLTNLIINSFVWGHTQTHRQTSLDPLAEDRPEKEITKESPVAQGMNFHNSLLSKGKRLWEKTASVMMWAGVSGLTSVASGSASAKWRGTTLRPSKPTATGRDWHESLQELLFKLSKEIAWSALSQREFCS